MGLEFTVMNKKAFLLPLILAALVIAGNAAALDWPDVGHEPNQLNLTPIYIDTVNLRVGIGVPAPSETLDVDGNIANTGNIATTDITATGNLAVAGDIAVNNIAATGTVCDVNGCIGAGGESLWTQSGSDIYYDTAGGNVGIGTSSPGTKLAVSDNAGNTVISVSSPAGQWSALDFYQGASNEWGIGKDNLGSFYIDESGAGRRLTILPGGKVGIGTTNPESTLTIIDDQMIGDGLFVQNINGGVSAYTVIEMYSPDDRRASFMNFPAYYTSPSLQGTFQISNGDQLGAKLRLQQMGDNPIVFHAGASTPERMRIDGATGNVGIGTANPEFRLTLDKDAATPDGGILAIGTHGSGEVLATTGAGTRLIWYPRKAAFRAGAVYVLDGTDEWDDANIGEYSVALGWGGTASGQGSVALGTGGIASGVSSRAIGAWSNATGYASTAMGYYTKATNSQSTSMGRFTTASGMFSLATGYETTASGDFSIATGRGIEAQGDYSVAIALDDQTGTVVSQGNTMAIMGGDVGIGTTSPGARLHVQHSGSGSVFKLTQDGLSCRFEIGSGGCPVGWVSLGTHNGRYLCMRCVE